MTRWNAEKKCAEIRVVPGLEFVVAVETGLAQCGTYNRSGATKLDLWLARKAPVSMLSR